MADPIDTLEQMIDRAVCNLDGDDVLIRIHGAIDQWRKDWAGDRIYISRHSSSRREEMVKQMAQDGKGTSEIAKEIGVSPRQIRRMRQSSYI